MICFLSNKQMRKQQTPRAAEAARQVPRPTPSSHMEFEKFATFSEGVILDELDRHYKEEKEKQKEIDDLYKKLLEKEKEKEDEALKEREDQKKIEKVKLPLLPSAKTEAGGRKPKTKSVSKNSSSKPLSTVSQLRLPRWH